jgi:hypothetical protein
MISSFETRGWYARLQSYLVTEILEHATSQATATRQLEASVFFFLSARMIERNCSIILATPTLVALENS